MQLPSKKSMGRPQGRSADELDDGIAYIVINSVVPYGYEINNILAPPAGFRYRGRYKEKWFGITPARLIGRRAMLVLRDYYTPATAELPQFVPLRYARVCDVKAFGSIARFEYELDEYVPMPTDVAVRAAVLKVFSERLEHDIAERREQVERTYGKHRYRQGDLTPLLYFAPHIRHQFAEYEPLPKEERWGNIVEELMRRRPYDRFDFLQVLRLQIGRSEGMVPIRDGAARLVPNALYEVDVLQLTAEVGTEATRGGTNHLLHLRADPSELRVLRSPYPIVGKYDTYTFRFRTLAVDQDVAALLRVERPSTQSLATVLEKQANHSQSPIAESTPPSRKDERQEYDQTIGAIIPAEASEPELAQVEFETPRAPYAYVGPVPDVVFPLTVSRTRSSRWFALVRLAIAVAALAVFLSGIGDSSVSTTRQIAFVVFVLATAESLPALARSLARQRSGAAARAPVTDTTGDLSTGARVSDE